MTALRRLAEFDARTIRFPEPERSELERALAAANQRSRDHGIVHLERSIPGLPWADLAQGVDSNTMATARTSPGFVNKLGGLGPVDQFFGGTDLGAGLKLFRDGEDLPLHAFGMQVHPEPLGGTSPQMGVVTALLD